MTTAAILLAVYVSLALGTSFLCSVLEAALLSTRELELRGLAAEGDTAAQRLLDIKQNRVDDAISAILTLNTIAHTVGSTMAGAQAAIVFGDAWLGVFSGVLTLLVLVVTEIIPKTLGTVYAIRLVGFVGITIKVLMFGLTPILFFTRMLTRLFTAGSHEAQVSRGEVAALIAIAARQGTLAKSESNALSNLLRLDEIRVTDVMTPRTVARMLPSTSTVEDFLASEQHRAFSRIPLFDDARDNVQGYVIVREVLAAAARGAGASTPMREHMRPVNVVDDKTSVATLLEKLLGWREHMAIVVDEFGGMEGLITLEDVLETLLGREILDELDTVADLRQLAVDLRDRRLKRHSLNELPTTTEPSSDAQASPAPAVE